LVHDENTAANNNSEVGSIAAMAQDILILLLPYLPQNDSQALFNLCLTPQVLTGKDSGVQKRGYKILARLIDKDKVEVDILVVLETIDKFLEGLTPAAKKVIRSQCHQVLLLTNSTGSFQLFIHIDTPSTTVGSSHHIGNNSRSRARD